MAHPVIEGISTFHPGEKIPNEFFDRLNIGSEASWVKDRTGIEHRHSVLPWQTLLALKEDQTSLETLRSQNQIPTIADMAEEAFFQLKKILPNADQDIDAVICGSSVPDYDIPANACTISARLKLQCPSFDVNAACSSFIVDLHTARGLLTSGLHKKMAIFNPERYSLRIDYTDRTSAALFGDGCSAAIVRSDALKGLEVLDTLIRSDPEKFETVQIPVGGTFRQSGQSVQKFAITRTIETTKLILERNGYTPKDLDFFAGHQANLRMVESAAAKLGIPPEKHLYNVDQFGNQGAAGLPSVLAQNWSKFTPGQLIAVAVVGSGLTWGAALLRVR